MEGLVITNVVPISIWKDGIYDRRRERLWKWDHPVAKRIAIMDGCPTVRLMEQWFKDQYDLSGGLDAEIIRWGVSR